MELFFDAFSLGLGGEALRNDEIKVLALSMYDSESSIIRMLKCGARGYILKDSEPAELYGVRAIPSNFLIDENGVIVARNLKGEDLHNTLNELLN